jgi:hypothetical protein
VIGGTVPRGFRSEVGEQRITQNGYRQIRTERGWEFLHRVVAEEKLGRPLEEGERVTFKDRDPLNCDPDNIETYTSRWRHDKELEIDRLEDIIGKSQARIDKLRQELEERTK